MRTPLKIGLIGFYGRGNFGDDLMSILIGRRVCELGHRCMVVGMQEVTARTYSLEAVPSPEALGDDLDAIIVGGGAILAHPPVWASHSLDTYLHGAIGDLETVITRCRNQGVPLLAVSIGGDGTPAERLMPFQRRLIETASFATVRNLEDIALFRAFGKGATWHPDIVLDTGRMFPPPLCPARLRKTVGIDLYLRPLFAHGALYVPSLIKIIAHVRRDVDFVFIDTTSRQKAAFRAVRPPRCVSNTRSYQFGSLEEDLSLIAKLDLVISNRLHLGVAALSYGVPFISLMGQAKTRFFMKQTGLADFYFDHRRIGTLVHHLLDRSWPEAAVACYPQMAARSAIDSSCGHLRDLEEALAALCR